MLPLRILACLAVLLPAASFAQDIVANATPAAVESSTFRLDFAPQVEYDGATLTVSGPGHFYLRQAFAAGDPIFVASEVDGVSLADGQYAWELALSPRLSASTRQALARAREAGDEAQLSSLRKSGALPSAPMIASGFFRVEQGAIVASDQTEAPGAGSRRLVREKQPGIVRVASADQVIPDDLIVQQSLCVGFDCVNNESFGFDTIRLKENNTRIKFEDTSTGTFPSNDWQLTANDSASGGANKFSIEDITGARVPFTVRAGAATNSIFVDPTGRVGFRTSTPVLDLHVATGNTPGIRLEQNSTGGFTAQTWDVAGNEANFFVRDVTGGSRLPLRIRPGAPTSSVDISADGDVGIGTSSPDNPLHVFRSSTGFIAGLNLENGAGDVGFRLTNDGGAVDVNLIGGAGAQEFRVNFGSAPAELVLQQDGDLIITGTYAPDYVFDTDYPLLPLDDLAAFIADHGHLPNVPSDAEVRESGRINLSEFQLRLLEKIEELTLYTLEQHRSLDALEKANDELRRRLAALESQVPPQ